MLLRAGKLRPVDQHGILKVGTGGDGSKDHPVWGIPLVRALPCTHSLCSSLQMCFPVLMNRVPAVHLFSPLCVPQAWAAGGYSDDLILAAQCTEQKLPIAVPSFSIYPQW